MLKQQKRRAIFSGGLEAARLKPWIAEALADLHPDRLYFAYDTPSDYGPLCAYRLSQRHAGGGREAAASGLLYRDAQIGVGVSFSG